jgi:hypothetical protein
VFKAVSTGWERAFIAMLNTELAEVCERLMGVFMSVIQACQDGMVAAQVTVDQI